MAGVSVRWRVDQEIKMPKAVTHYVAAPIAMSDTGAVLVDPDGAVECRSAGAAIETAQQMSLQPHFIGTLAYVRSGDPTTGRYGPVEVLRQFGGFLY